MDTKRIAAIATQTAPAVEPRMSETAGPAVEVAGLTKRYGAGALALDDLSFSVRRVTDQGLRRTPCTARTR